MLENEEIYIHWYIPYLRIAIDLMPLKVRNILIHFLMGMGMRTFRGRHQGLKDD